MKAFYETRSYDSGLKVWHNVYNNIHFIPHWHFEIELIYVRGGVAEINIEGDKILAKEGDLVICDSGLIHSSSSKYMDNHLEFIIFDPTIINPGFDGFQLKNTIITKDELEEYQMTDHLHNLLNVIEIEKNNRDVFYEEIILSSMKTFCFTLYRKIRDREKREDNSNFANVMNFKNLLYYIENNFDQQITLKDGADIMHLSESYFSTKFKDYTGYSFIDYINITRIESSVNDLLNSSKSITDVAYSNGFNNIKTFNRVFKGVTGKTPSQIKKQHNTISKFSFAKARRSALRTHTNHMQNKTLVKDIDLTQED